MVSEENALLLQPQLYLIRPESDQSSGLFTPRRGPRFKFIHRAPTPRDDYASTMSDSKRSSAYQVRVLMIGKQQGNNF